MLILSNGHAKSGSSFIYQLAESMVESVGYDQKEIRAAYLPSRMIPYAPHPHFADFELGDVREICDSLPNDVWMVVKTHSYLTQDMLELLQEGRVKALYSFRDPRDAAVSLRDSARKEEHLPVAERRFAGIDTQIIAIQVMANRVSYAIPWLQTPSVLTIDYRDVVKSVFDVSNRIKEYLEVQVDTGSLLRNYLQEKQKIREFNVGISGRHTSNFGLLEESLCRLLFARFEEAINGDVNEQGFIFD